MVESVSAFRLISATSRENSSAQLVFLIEKGESLSSFSSLRKLNSFPSLLSFQYQLVLHVPSIILPDAEIILHGVVQWSSRPSSRIAFLCVHLNMVRLSPLFAGPLVPFT